MQIMPTIFSDATTSSYLGAEYGYDDTSSNFADEMERQQEARDAVESGAAHSVEVALEPLINTTPLVDSPYSLTTNDGVTYTSEEVLFTKSELEQLERELRYQGAADENLEELRKLADQPDGATLHQVLSSFYNKREYQALSDADLATLKGMANKIDPSGKLAEELLAQANGINGKDGQKLLNTLIGALNNLPNNGTINLSQNELATLAKAAGLSDESTNTILKNFGSHEFLQFTKDGLTNVLAPALHEFAQEDKNLVRLDKALDEVLGPILSEARSRMQKEAEAYALSLRSVEQSKVVIEKTVLETVNQNLENARASQSGTTTAQSEQNKLNTQNLENKQLQDNNAKQNAFAGHDEDAKTDVKDDGKSKRDNQLSNMLNKAEVRTMASTASNNVNTPIIGIGGFAQTAGLAEAAQQTQATSMLSQQAASQIERAMLSAAADGTKRLDLQLHPAELGTVTITLTSRNGELNALIRSERPETTELLHKQLDYIRSALEQQGLKVDKIDVQTGTQENNSQYDQWDSMNEHNARQEENSRREVLERLRNLGNTLNNNINTDETTLEQHVQLDSYTAVNAGQPLHIVA